MKRLSAGAILGIVIVAALSVSCDGEEDGVSGRGFVYVGTMDIQREPVYKLDAGDGEKVLGLSWVSRGGLSVDVSRETGDVYVYTNNRLGRYSKDGERLFEVYVDSGGMGDSMVLDEKSRAVWIHKVYAGDIDKYDADSGTWLDRIFTGVTARGQLVDDQEEGALWLATPPWPRIHKYSTATRERLLEIELQGWIGPVALDRRNGTLVFGWTSDIGETAYIKRYDKQGKELGSFATGYRHPPSATGVEPTTGTIWVSDSERTERFKPDGTPLDPLNDTNFVLIEFSYDGSLVFGVDKGGTAFALQTDNLEVIWTQKIQYEEEYWAIKFCDK